MNTNSKKYEIVKIGEVNREADKIFLQIDEEYREGLLHLDTFSHVHVFWWAGMFDNQEQRSILTCGLPYANNKKSGVFACLSPERPNLIMTTVCEVQAVDIQQGLVEIANIDAFDGTPILDLKPYFPVCDLVQDARISDWLVGWPDEFPAEGIGLMEHEL